jgi:HEAT repeat protein
VAEKDGGHEISHALYSRALGMIVSGAVPMRFVFGFTIALAAFSSSLCLGQQPQTLRDLVSQFNTTRVFWQQVEIAKKIVAMDDASVLPQLEPWLTNDDRHLRANAAFIFASLGDSRGFDVITAILNDRSERPQAQGAPVRSGYWTLRLQIIGDRYYAAHILGDLKDRRAVPILLSLLRDADINDIVPWALGRIGDKSSVQPLIGALKDQDPKVRILAICALKELNATEALPSLRPLLDDSGRGNYDVWVTVAGAARAAVAKLENVSH